MEYTEYMLNKENLASCLKISSVWRMLHHFLLSLTLCISFMCHIIIPAFPLKYNVEIDKWLLSYHPLA